VRDFFWGIYLVFAIIKLVCIRTSEGLQGQGFKNLGIRGFEHSRILGKELYFLNLYRENFTIDYVG